MKESCITHLKNSKIIILKEDFLIICDGNIAAALLLGYLEYWHNIKLEMSKKNKEYNDVAERHGDKRNQDEKLYQFHTAEELYDSLMGLCGKTSINKGINLLVSKKFISIHKNPNPRYKFDNTKHFLLHPDLVNLVMWSTQNGKTVYPKKVDGLPKMVTTIPEITTEITTEITNLAKSNFADDSINSLIEAFKQINPSYEQLYKKKNQREALERLIKKYTYAKTEAMINALPAIISQKYAPQITTPLQLEEKLGRLLIFIKNNNLPRGISLANKNYDI